MHVARNITWNKLFCNDHLLKTNQNLPETNLTGHSSSINCFLIAFSCSRLNRYSRFWLRLLRKKMCSLPLWNPVSCIAASTSIKKGLIAERPRVVLIFFRHEFDRIDRHHHNQSAQICLCNPKQNDIIGGYDHCTVSFFSFLLTWSVCFDWDIFFRVEKYVASIYPQTKHSQETNTLDCACSFIFLH